MYKHYYIPLTFDCSGANALRDKNLRVEAFPFDWNIKTIDSIYNLIKNDFNDLFKKEYLLYGNNTFIHKYDNNNNEYKNLIPVYNINYKILFVHDFSNITEENYLHNSEKYMKRIHKMINILTDKNNHISFVIHNNTFNINKIYNEWNKYYDDNNIFNNINEKKYNLDDLYKLIIDKYNNNNIRFIYIDNI